MSVRHIGHVCQVQPNIRERLSLFTSIPDRKPLLLRELTCASGGYPCHTTPDTMKPRAHARSHGGSVPREISGHHHCGQCLAAKKWQHLSMSQLWSLQSMDPIVIVACGSIEVLDSRITKSDVESRINSIEAFYQQHSRGL